MAKRYVFIDTESTIFRKERVIYDLSITVVEQKQNITNKKFTKHLRNRFIDNDDKNLKEICSKNILVFEYADLVPEYKQTLYGYSDYEYMFFADAVNVLKILCDIYKPDAIMGYNLIADLDAIKNTQKVLKTSKIIYNNTKTNVPPYKLFYANKCNAFDNAVKSDLMIYLCNFCPNFIKQQEEFCEEHRLLTKTGYTSQTLQNMYRYSVNNPSIEQIHIGVYDNMFAIECLSQSILTDGCMYIPFNGMIMNKRKRCKAEEDLKQTKKIKYLMNNETIPEWYEDQKLNSKCSKTEEIEDIRRFHPDFGGTNSKKAPYFRGCTTGSGIWPPSYLENNK